jgi:hypothetical protein
VRVHRDFSDPSKLVSDQESEIEAAFVATREEIKTFTKAFLAEHLT